MKMKRIAAVLALCLAAPFAMASQPTHGIGGLVNTGAWLDAGAQDTHYALSVLSGTTTGLGSLGYVASASAWPANGPWIPDGSPSTSQWLTPTINQSQSFDASTNGVYQWQLAFNLPSSNASFVGRWAADNYGVVFLNGHEIGTSNGYTSWSSFAANSGFHSGRNILDFVVTNTAQLAGNPTGIRVEFSSSSAAPIPEPDTYVLMLGGLGMVAYLRRKQSKATGSAV